MKKLTLLTLCVLCLPNLLNCKMEDTETLEEKHASYEQQELDKEARGEKGSERMTKAKGKNRQSTGTPKRTMTYRTESPGSASLK